MILWDRITKYWGLDRNLVHIVSSFFKTECGTGSDMTTSFQVLRARDLVHVGAKPIVWLSHIHHAAANPWDGITRALTSFFIFSPSLVWAIFMLYRT